MDLYGGDIKGVHAFGQKSCRQVEAIRTLRSVNLEKTGSIGELYEYFSIRMNIF